MTAEELAYRAQLSKELTDMVELNGDPQFWRRLKIFLDNESVKAGQVCFTESAMHASLACQGIINCNPI